MSVTPHTRNAAEEPSVGKAAMRGSSPLEEAFARHQSELLGTLYYLVGNLEDARDALQETSVALYRKFADYDPAKPFLAWAYGFAYLEVLKQRERISRCGRHLREDLVELLARERQSAEPELHARLQALEGCLQDLPPRDRDIINQRYTVGCPIDELVQRLGTSRRTLFRNLDRIRRTLFDCINRRLQAAS